MRWTVSKAATEWGIDRRTLTERLKAIGLDARKGVKFHTRDISRAVTGDLEQERILETRERRLALERDRLEADGDLVRFEGVNRLYTEACLPIRQRLLALPAEASSRCNPSDPKHARDVLQRWVDDALPLIRKDLPKPKKPRK